MYALLYAIFQFLMVRLKGPQRFCLLPSLLISIPYGSIKRSDKADVKIRHPISIPYGSIKSLPRYYVKKLID